MAREDTPAERRAFFAQMWASPGFMKFTSNYVDLLFDAEVNAEWCAFIAEQIRGLVHDPKVAEKLIPNDHPYGAKRPFSFHWGRRPLPFLPPFPSLPFLVFPFLPLSSPPPLNRAGMCLAACRSPWGNDRHNPGTPPPSSSFWQPLESQFCLRNP